jgi:hypothetical protein
MNILEVVGYGFTLIIALTVAITCAGLILSLIDDSLDGLLKTKIKDWLND